MLLVNVLLGWSFQFHYGCPPAKILSKFFRLSARKRIDSCVCFIFSQVVCPEPRKSDCYHLTVNLLDRYLGYRKPKVGELPAIIGACTMISMKLRRSTRECLSYQQLRYHFSNISEQNIRVCKKMLCVCVCVCV